MGLKILVSSILQNPLQSLLTTQGNLIADDPVLWLDASDLSTIGVSGSDVLTWTDKTTLKQFASQVGNRPVIGAGINGLNTINFVDAVSFMQYTGFIGYREVFCVVKLSENNRLGQVIGNFAQGVQVGIDMRAPNQGTFSFDGALSTQAKYALNYDNYSTTFVENTTPSDPTLGIDIAQSIAVEFNNTVNPLENYISALLPTFPVANQSIEGEIGEILVYNRTLDETERFITRNYLNQRWNIPT